MSGKGAGGKKVKKTKGPKITTASKKKKTKTKTKKGSTASRGVKRLIEAHKGEDVHIKKLIVSSKETVEVADAGGTLKIDIVEVKKGGKFAYDFGKQRAGGPVIGEVKGTGCKVLQF